MTVSNKKQVSKTYEQLAQLFKALETAAFVEGIDFGENLTGAFQWFLSPAAALYFQKRFPDDWKALVEENNSRFTCRPVPWQGHKGMALDINLNI